MHARTTLYPLRPNGLAPRFWRLRLIDAPVNDGTPGVTPDPTPETPPTPQTQAPGAPESADEWDGKVESLPKGARELIKSLRGEAASSRVQAKDTAAKEAREAVVAEIVKALGGDTKKDVPTVEQLTGQVTAAQETAKASQVELAVYKAAGAHKADPAALLDSRAFLAKLDDLDPAAKDFDAQVATVIKTAVTENPKLAVRPPAGASTIDRPSSGKTAAPKPLGAAIAAHYSA